MDREHDPPNACPASPSLDTVAMRAGAAEASGEVGPGARATFADNATDLYLLRRIAAHDRDAYALFYERHAARVLGLLVRLLGRRDAAEDVLQDTFWHVWTRAGQYDALRSGPVAWLVMVARSRAIDHQRRGRRNGGAAALPELPDAGDASVAAERGEARESAKRSLARLPAEQRELIELAFFCGWTHEQIAERTDTPLGTVKTRIRLGMRRLRELLARAG